VLCGRAVRVAPSTIWVECVGGALNAYPTDAPRLDPDLPDLVQHGIEMAGYMGCFPVGPSCAKKIPARYRRPTAEGAADPVTAGLGYDRDVLEAAQRIEAAALALADLIDGANPDVCKKAEALLLDKSTAPTEPRRHGPPAWRRLFFLDVAEATARRGGE